MDEKKFSTLYVARLAVEEIFSLCKSTIDLSTPLSEELGVVPNAALTELAEVNNKLGAALNKSQKSELSGLIETNDKGRDGDLQEIFRTKNLYLRSRDAAKKKAAEELDYFLSPYKGVYKLPLDVESGVVSEMMAKYNASEALKAAATALGIDGIFTSLGTYNTGFDTLYKQRTVSAAARGASASSLRNKVVSAYMQFTTAIEQLATFVPTDALISLFFQLDEVRKQYHPLEGGEEKEDEKKS